MIYETKYGDELMHYGVPGMKWGQRKAVTPNSAAGKVQSAKSAYKSAKKAYNKSFNKAYGYSYLHPVSQYVSKTRKAESSKRWTDAQTKAKAAVAAKAAYKKTKADYKRSKQTATTKKSNSNNKFMDNMADLGAGGGLIGMYAKKKGYGSK